MSGALQLTAFCCVPTEVMCGPLSFLSLSFIFIVPYIGVVFEAFFLLSPQQWEKKMTKMLFGLDSRKISVEVFRGT